MLVPLNFFRRLTSLVGLTHGSFGLVSGCSLVTVPRSRWSFSPNSANRSDGGCRHRRLEISVSAFNPSRQQRRRECQFEYYPIPRISTLNWLSVRFSTQLVYGSKSSIFLVALA